jgi:hypothetical protein
MSFLQSSLFGREFVNYRKNSAHYERTRFSSIVRSQGVGLVPIVVDSVDNILSVILGENDPSSTKRDKKYGKEYTLHMDTTIEDFLNQINIDLKSLSATTLAHQNYMDGKKLKIGLEDGTIVDLKLTLGYVYKKYRNEKDNILYILLTQENTMYGYIISILRYLGLIK